MYSNIGEMINDNLSNSLNEIKNNRQVQWTNNSNEPLILATIDLSNWLNLRIGLYLGCLGKSEDKV
jgi:hypothetical protein